MSGGGPRRVPAGQLSALPELLGDVKLIGVGGTGGIVARFAALYLASLKAGARLVLLDGDAFEASNASRMFFGGNGNKAEVVRRDLLRYLGEGDWLTLDAIAEYVTPANVERLIREGDIVLLAVDNHATRKLVGDFCAGREDVCLISGGNDGVGENARGRALRGTAGNCQIYIRCGGRDVTPSLTAFHPEIERPADERPDESCTAMLESVPQILFANLTAAAMMLNTLWLYLCGALHYPELVFDIAEGLMRPVDLPLPDFKPAPARGGEAPHGQVATTSIRGRSGPVPRRR